MTAVYVDTSALAKWYLNEQNSEAFSAWIQRQEDVRISSLTVLEFRCLLARGRRADELTPELEQQVFETFQLDIQSGHLLSHPVTDRHITGAVHLIGLSSGIPLRTLDAIHLNIVLDLGAEGLATADRVMAQAAEALRLQVTRFD